MAPQSPSFSFWRNEQLKCWITNKFSIQWREKRLALWLPQHLLGQLQQEIRDSKLRIWLLHRVAFSNRTQVPDRIKHICHPLDNQFLDVHSNQVFKTELLYLYRYWILYQNDETLEGRRLTCGTTKHCSLRLVQAVTEHLCKPTRTTLGNLSYSQSNLSHSLTIRNTRHLWVMSSGLINVYTGLNAFYPLSQKLLTVFLTYWHASLNIPVRCLDVEDKAIWYWHSKLTLSFRFTYIYIWEGTSSQSSEMR